MPLPVCPTREVLLQVAERLFATKGYAAVGTREIAEAAGVNIASISYHFGSKHDLYLCTVERGMCEAGRTTAWSLLFHADLDELDGLAASVLLQRFVDRYLAHVLEAEARPSCGMLLLWEAVQPTDAIETVVTQHVQPCFERLMAVVEQALRPEDKSDACFYARSVLAEVLYYHVHRPITERLAARSGERPIVPDHAGRHVGRVVLRMLGHDEAAIGEIQRRARSAAAGAEKEPSHEHSHR